MAHSTDNEILEVVDGADAVVGRARRADIHAGGLLHRAVHVLVFDGGGRLYLQKRSDQKDTHPGKWTTSASGHVDPGETYAQAARRELAEELGLTLELRLLGKLSPSPRTEGEFAEVYTAVTGEAPRPDPAEISGGAFYGQDEALALAADAARAAPCLLEVLSLLWPGQSRP